MVVCKCVPVVITGARSHVFIICCLTLDFYLYGLSRPARLFKWPAFTTIGYICLCARFKL
jgi:hypothetical protein